MSGAAQRGDYTPAQAYGQGYTVGLNQKKQRNPYDPDSDLFANWASGLADGTRYGLNFIKPAQPELPWERRWS